MISGFASGPLSNPIRRLESAGCSSLRSFEEGVRRKINKPAENNTQYRVRLDGSKTNSRPAHPLFPTEVGGMRGVKHPLATLNR